MQNWHLSPPLFLLRIGKFFQPTDDNRRNWQGYENFTSWLRGLICPLDPKGNAEFFGRQYPRPLIDNEVEAYSDELAKVDWEMCDKREVWSNSCREVRWAKLSTQWRVVQVCMEGVGKTTTGGRLGHSSEYRLRQPRRRLVQSYYSPSR